MIWTKVGGTDNNFPTEYSPIIKDVYFDSDRGKGLKGRTTDINRYELHITATVGRMRVPEITELDVQKIRRLMQDKAPATIRNTLELFRRLVNFGVARKLCPHWGLRLNFHEWITR